MFYFRNLPFLTAFQILSILIFLLAPSASFAWTGNVVGIADGDTITVIHNGRGEKIRLHGIDTPEKGQAFGNKAKAVTGSMLRGRVVEITLVTTDRYGRTVAQVHVDGQSLNESLVRSGYAWVYRKYCKEAFCADWLALEESARNHKKGMWCDPHIIPPWEYRQIGRGQQVSSPSFVMGASGGGSKAPVVGSYHGNVNSLKFHRPGCRVYNCKNCTTDFASREEGISAGYAPCKLCNP